METAFITLAKNKGSLTLELGSASSSLVKSSIVFFKVDLLICPALLVEIPTIVIFGRKGVCVRS